MHNLTKPQRTLLYACFYAFFCNGLIALMQGSMMPDMKAAYGLTDTIGGLMLSAHSIGNLAAGFLSGVVGVWLGRKKTAIMLSSLAFIVFTGVGRGSISNFNNGTVNAITGGSATASNLLHAVFATGAIVTPMAFLVLKGAFGWKAGPVFVTICGTISVLNLTRVTVENDKPARKDSARDFSFMNDPVFLVLAAMMLFYLCSEYAINGWLVTYIQSKESLRAGLSGEGDITAYSQTMATLLWVVILVGRLFCAWLSQRVHPRKLMLIASIGEAAAFAGVLFSSTLPAVTVCVALTGFCMAGICPMIYADAAFYTNTYPMSTGILLSFGSIGGIAMPTVVGALADRYGFGGGMSAILFAICALVLCAAANAMMKRKYQEEV